MEQEARIKHAILKMEFSPLGQQGFDPARYPPSSLVGQLPQQFDDKQVLNLIDTHTTGNNGAIVSSGNSGAQWLIMSPETLEELKANLRAGTQTKFPGSSHTQHTR